MAQIFCLPRHSLLPSTCSGTGSCSSYMLVGAAYSFALHIALRLHCNPIAPPPPFSPRHATRCPGLTPGFGRSASRPPASPGERYARPGQDTWPLPAPAACPEEGPCPPHTNTLECYARPGQDAQPFPVLLHLIQLRPVRSTPARLWAAAAQAHLCTSAGGPDICSGQSARVAGGGVLPSRVRHLARALHPGTTYFIYAVKQQKNCRRFFLSPDSPIKFWKVLNSSGLSQLARRLHGTSMV